MMKNKNIILPLLAALLLVFFTSALLARGPVKYNPQFHKTQVDKVTRTLSNASNWAYWVVYDGMSAHDPINDDSGGVYPRQTTTVIFTDGLVWGGYAGGINHNNLEENLRVGGVTYAVGTVPGYVHPDHTPATTADERVRMYRIRRDFTKYWDNMTADEKATAMSELKADAAEHNAVDVGDVTEDMVKAIVDAYAWSWENWPADLGAPVYPDGTPGLADADQVVWFAVNDFDPASTNALYGSPPIGLEIATTIWSYNQPSSTLGQLIFKKYRIINHSGAIIDSMFVSQWSDPDVGNYTDDLTGCDVDKSLMIGYSGFLTDDQFSAFNLPPACVGYDFFQGPIVPSAGDTAVFNLQYLPGYKNLPMTSYGFFSAGSDISDPPLGDPAGTLQWYNMLNGYTPTEDLVNPTPYLHGAGSLRGQPTKFPMDGDPFLQTGDIDATGDNFPPGDRRMFMCSGPFTMQPGDTQEVAVAVIGGIIQQAGGNNRNAVAQLKINDDFAQFIYNKLFEGIPKPPSPAPTPAVTILADEVVLNWGTDPSVYNETEKDDPILGFNFEGYNVYQLPNAQATKEQAKLIATFDKDNFITIIRAKKFLPEFGDVVTVPVQKGTDSGIQRYFVIDKDYINDGPLYPGSTYYFAVTAYNFNDDPTVPEPSLETSLKPIEVVVQPELPGTKYNAKGDQALDVSHAVGVSDGVVQAIVIDPASLTGHEYEVFFTLDEDTNSATYGEILWNLKDKTTGEVVMANQPQAADPNTPKSEQIVDGLLIKVSGPAPGTKAVIEQSNGSGPLVEDDWDGVGTPFQGNSVWHSLSAPSDPNRFYISAGGGGGTIDRMDRNIANAEAHDFEMRFTSGGGIYLWWYDDDTWANVPFEVWDVGIATFDDATDDIRGLTGGYSGGTATGPNGFTFDYTDPYFGFPATDWIYFRIPTDDQGSYDNFYNDVTSGTLNYVWWDHSKEVLARVIICDFGGGAVLPEEGTVIRWYTNKPNAETDVFTFKAPSVEQSTALAKEAAKKINVFPNPYYAFNPQETNRFDRFVTFNHLPKKAKIRIFNLAGTLVRTLDKDDPGQFTKWDLKNENGLPVASGLYIAHIDLPDLGMTRILKVFIVQSQQILEYY